MKTQLYLSIMFCLAISILSGQNDKELFQGKSQINFGIVAGIKQKLDSAIFNDTSYYKYKEEFIYDEKGRVIVKLFSNNDPEGANWQTLAKTEIEYDANNNINRITNYNASADGNMWFGTSRDEYTYDLSGNLTKYIYSYWEEGVWLYYQKRENIYDEHSNLIIETNYAWYKWQNIWKRTWKYELSYNEFDYLSESSSYKWQEGSDIWKVFGRNRYTYDENLNKTEKLRLLWSETTSFWVNNEKYSYDHDSSGNLTLEVKQKWNTELNEWIKDRKAECTFDEINRLVDSTSYNWYVPENRWNILTGFLFIFDTNGNRIQRLEHRGPGINGDLINLKKSENNYNDNYSRNDLILPNFNYYDMALFTHMLVGTNNSQWSEPFDRWISMGNTNYYYSEFVYIGMQENHDLGVKIYPNPANSLLNIDIGNEIQKIQFDLYDVQGRKLISKQLTENTQIDVSRISGGIYFFSLISADKLQSGKLIIQ